MSSAKQPMRLPPLRVLRVRNPNRSEGNPCMAIMSSVLSCWASAGYSASGCATVEQALRNCMDGPKPPQGKKNTINYHLSRMKDKVEGPTKQKK